MRRCAKWGGAAGPTASSFMGFMNFCQLSSMGVGELTTTKLHERFNAPVMEKHGQGVLMESTGSLHWNSLDRQHNPQPRSLGPTTSILSRPFPLSVRPHLLHTNRFDLEKLGFRVGSLLLARSSPRRRFGLHRHYQFVNSQTAPQHETGRPIRSPSARSLRISGERWCGKLPTAAAAPAP